MGFCTDDEARWFLKAAAPVEMEVVNSGIVLLKY
jgi:polyphosphate kinase 2 (PPK2 family)